MPNLQQNLQGSFVETTNVWTDMSEIYALNKESDQLKELFVKLYQNLNIMSIVINSKETGNYYNEEMVNSQIYFPNPALNSLSSVTPTARQVIRLVVNFGALPNATTKSVAHGIEINQAYTFTRIYACASDVSGLNYIPIPFAATVATDSILLRVDDTNVYITTAVNYSVFTVCYVVLEYITQ